MGDTSPSRPSSKGPWPAASPWLQEKWQAQDYEAHLQRIRAATPVTDSGEPKAWSLRNPGRSQSPKGKWLQEVRAREMQRENERLVGKMQEIVYSDMSMAASPQGGLIASNPPFRSTFNVAGPGYKLGPGQVPVIDHRNPHVPSTLKGKHQWMSADVVMLQNIAMHNRLVAAANLAQTNRADGLPASPASTGPRAAPWSPGQLLPGELSSSGQPFPFGVRLGSAAAAAARLAHQQALLAAAYGLNAQLSRRTLSPEPSQARGLLSSHEPSYVSSSQGHAAGAAVGAYYGSLHVLPGTAPAAVRVPDGLGPYAPPLAGDGAQQPPTRPFTTSADAAAGAASEQPSAVHLPLLPGQQQQLGRAPRQAWGDDNAPAGAASGKRRGAPPGYLRSTIIVAGVPGADPEDLALVLGEDLAASGADLGQPRYGAEDAQALGPDASAASDVALHHPSGRAAPRSTWATPASAGARTGPRHHHQAGRGSLLSAPARPASVPPPPLDNEESELLGPGAPPAHNEQEGAGPKQLSPLEALALARGVPLLRPASPGVGGSQWPPTSPQSPSSQGASAPRAGRGRFAWLSSGASSPSATRASLLGSLGAPGRQAQGGPHHSRSPSPDQQRGLPPPHQHSQEALHEARQRMHTQAGVRAATASAAAPAAKKPATAVASSKTPQARAADLPPPALGLDGVSGVLSGSASTPSVVAPAHSSRDASAPSSVHSHPAATAAQPPPLVAKLAKREDSGDAVVAAAAAVPPPLAIVSAELARPQSRDGRGEGEEAQHAVGGLGETSPLPGALVSRSLARIAGDSDSESTPRHAAAAVHAGGEAAPPVTTALDAGAAEAEAEEVAPAAPEEPAAAQHAEEAAQEDVQQEEEQQQEEAEQEAKEQGAPWEAGGAAAEEAGQAPEQAEEEPAPAEEGAEEVAAPDGDAPPESAPPAPAAEPPAPAAADPVPEGPGSAAAAAAAQEEDKEDATKATPVGSSVGAHAATSTAGRLTTAHNTEHGGATTTDGQLSVDGAADGLCTTAATRAPSSTAGSQHHPAASRHRPVARGISFKQHLRDVVDAGPPAADPDSEEAARKTLLHAARSDALLGGHLAVVGPTNASHLSEALAQQQRMRERKRERKKSILGTTSSAGTSLFAEDFGMAGASPSAEADGGNAPADGLVLFNDGERQPRDAPTSRAALLTSISMGKHSPHQEFDAGRAEAADAAEHLLEAARADALVGGHLATVGPTSAAHLDEALAHQQRLRERKKERTKSRLALGTDAAGRLSQAGGAFGGRAPDAGQAHPDQHSAAAPALANEPEQDQQGAAVEGADAAVDEAPAPAGAEELGAEAADPEDAAAAPGDTAAEPDGQEETAAGADAEQPADETPALPPALVPTPPDEPAPEAEADDNGGQQQPVEEEPAGQADDVAGAAAGEEAEAEAGDAAVDSAAGAPHEQEDEEPAAPLVDGGADAAAPEEQEEQAAGAEEAADGSAAAAGPDAPEEQEAQQPVASDEPVAADGGAPEPPAEEQPAAEEPPAEAAVAPEAPAEEEPPAADAPVDVPAEREEEAPAGEGVAVPGDAADRYQEPAVEQEQPVEESGAAPEADEAVHAGEPEQQPEALEQQQEEPSAQDQQEEPEPVEGDAAAAPAEDALPEPQALEEEQHAAPGEPPAASPDDAAAAEEEPSPDPAADSEPPATAPVAEDEGEAAQASSEADATTPAADEPATVAEAEAEPAAAEPPATADEEAEAAPAAPAAEPEPEPELEPETAAPPEPEVEPPPEPEAADEASPPEPAGDAEAAEEEAAPPPAPEPEADVAAPLEAEPEPVDAATPAAPPPVIAPAHEEQAHEEQAHEAEPPQSAHKEEKKEHPVPPPKERASAERKHASDHPAAPQPHKEEEAKARAAESAPAQREAPPQPPPQEKKQEQQQRQALPPAPPPPVKRIDSTDSQALSGFEDLLDELEWPDDQY